MKRDRLFPRITVTTASGGLDFEPGDVIEMSGGWRPWWRRWFGLPAKRKRFIVAAEPSATNAPLVAPWRYRLRSLRAVITSRLNLWRALRRP